MKKLTMKLILFVSVFMFLGSTAMVAQSTPTDVLKTKLAELTQTQNATQYTTGSTVPLKAFSSLEQFYYQKAIEELTKGNSPAVAVEAAYQYVSKGGKNLKVLAYRAEAINLLNL